MMAEPLTAAECLSVLVEWWKGGRGHSRRLVLGPAGSCTITVSWSNETHTFMSTSAHVEEHTFADGLTWSSAALAAVRLLRERGQL